MNIVQRSRVLWFGAEPDEAVKQHFLERQLNLSFHGYQDEIDANIWAFSSGLVFKIQENKLGVFLARRKSLVIPALNHGLKVIVQGSSDSIKTLEAALSASPLLKQKIGLIVDKGPYEMPELIARHLAFSGPNYDANCKILPTSLKLSNTQSLFLKRAFSDCSELYLRKITSGKSATVYCVYATLSHINGAGIRSLPFFAKFDKRRKIEKERLNYDIHAAPFIPFNLRPNLDNGRCIDGAFESLLVGNFVENSESLSEVVQRGSAQTAIHSLFDNTLRAWRQDPINEQLTVPAVLGQINAGALTDTKWRRLMTRCRATEQYGEVFEPRELANLINALPPLRHRSARIHGDLHAENVRVRNNEAILIDFASVDWGPPTRDPASLEICLVFSQWPDQINFDQWRQLVDELYSPVAVTTLLRPKHEPDVGCTIWNHVRQIRSFAFAEQTELREYPSSLAYCLFLYATHKTENPEEEARRAYAYYLSNKLVQMVAELEAQVQQ